MNQNADNLLHLVKFMEETINDRDAQIKYLLAEREEQGKKYRALFQEYKKLLTNSSNGDSLSLDKLPF